MPRTCTVCSHPKVDEINELLLRNEACGKGGNFKKGKSMKIKEFSRLYG